MIIKTHTGHDVTIDDEDYEKIKNYNWGAYKHHNGCYYVISKKRKCTMVGWETIRIHRVIMDAPKGMSVDHINHDTLDNRKSNLRICTNAENRRNSISRKGLSKYKGVSFSKEMKKWQACIFPNKKAIRLGFFDIESEAAIAYNIAAKKYFGEYASLNEITT